MTLVRMSHPDLPDGQHIEVAEAAVPIHRAAGWAVVEDPTPLDAPASTDGSAPVAEVPAPAEDSSELPVRKRRRVSEESD